MVFIQEIVYPKKDRSYVINLDEYKLIAIQRIALCVNDENGGISCNATYFDGSEVENIPKDIKKSRGNKIIITNIYRIKAYNSKECGYFYIGLIHIMLKVKSLVDYTNLFSPNKYEENDKTILKYFQ